MEYDMKQIKHSLLRTFCIAMTAAVFFTSLWIRPMTAFAQVDYMAEHENNKTLPVQSNEIPGWPTGPSIGAKSAILMDAKSGTILYSKNIDEKNYPASTTKILTTLIAIEHSNLDDMITFSSSAVNIDYRSSNMGMDAGQSITMEQCLYGILVHSANEVANAVAEHVAGSIDEFVNMMNKRAAELGCTNSHFVTTNGLHDENHYTTARDLALIGRAFFANETLCKMSSTATYHIDPTPTQPDVIDCYTHNKITNGTYPYEYLVGSKTGYTDDARQTLVSCAEKDGMKLICVVMREETPDQFLDTITLFDYGFDNFHMANVAENETKYNISTSSFLEIKTDIYGDSNPILTIDPQANLILPNTVDFQNLESSLTYLDQKGDEIATISYSYEGILLGSASLIMSPQTEHSYDFSSDTKAPQEASEHVIFLNVGKIFIVLISVLILLLAAIFLTAFFRDYNFSDRFKRSSWGGSRPRSKMFRKSTRRRRTQRSNVPKHKNRDFFDDIHFR